MTVATPGLMTLANDNTTPPVLTVPADITVEGNTTGGADVTLPAATADDIVDSAPGVSCDQTSGFFPLDDTTVTCTATDASGNSSSASFTVTVEDTTGPDVSVPGDTTIGTTEPEGAVFDYAATAADLVDADPTLSCDPPSGSLFPLRRHYGYVRG